MKKTVLLCLILLSSCATQKPLTLQQKYNNRFKLDVENFEKNIDIYDMDKLWHAYLKSSQKSNTKSSQDFYDKIMADLNNGKTNCGSIDFKELINKNYWSLKPHILAMNCYSKLGAKIQSEKQQKVIAKIIRWSFSEGDGHYPEIPLLTANFGDAEDLIELSGYKVIDRYILTIANFQALRLAFIVEDNETHIQSTLYFSSDEFLFSIVNEGYKLYDFPMLMTLRVLSENNPEINVFNGMGLLNQRLRKYDSAETWFESAALAGSVYASTSLGELCLTKKLKNHNPEHCLTLFSQAAEKEYADAFLFLYGIYQHGIGVPSDHVMARQLLQIAEQKLGSGVAHFRLGKIYRRDVFGSKLHDNYVKWFQKSAKENNKDAAYKLYYYFKIKKKISMANKYLAMAIKNNSPQSFSSKVYAILGDSSNEEISNFPEAKKKHISSLLHKGMDYGDPDSFYIMGYLNQYKILKTKEPVIIAQKYYKRGSKQWHKLSLYKNCNLLINNYDNYPATSIVKAGYQVALKYCVRAARMGHIGAAVDSGYLLEGKAYKDLKVAFDYYKKAAENGNVIGQTNLGMMLRKGVGYPRDLEKAKFWLTKAANKNYATAINELGLVYESIKEYQKALELFHRAAKLNYKYALYNLGRFYENGLGVDKDLVLAKQWYLKAARLGHTIAKQRAEKL